MSLLRICVRAGLITVSLLSVSAPGLAERMPQPSVTVPAEVEALLGSYARAWAAKDTQALAGLFADDGMALPNGDAPAVGAAAIAAAYAKNAGSPLHLRPIAFEQSGDLAYVVGGFGPAPEGPEFGKFVVVLKRAPDGAWRLAADIDNINAPQPPAASADTDTATADGAP